MVGRGSRCFSRGQVSVDLVELVFGGAGGGGCVLSNVYTLDI